MIAIQRGIRTPTPSGDITRHIPFFLNSVAKCQSNDNSEFFVNSDSLREDV